MQLPFPDVLAALDQLAAATSSEVHRAALQAAIDAVHFQNAIESTIDRFTQESARRGAPAMPISRPLEKWSLDEDVQLRLEFESGMTLDVIAAQHVRSPLEVAERLNKPLGLLTEQAVEEIRTARNRLRAKFEYESAASGEEAFDPGLDEGSHGAVDANDDLPIETVEPEPVAAPVPAPAEAPAVLAVPEAPAPAPLVAAAPAPAPVVEPSAPAVVQTPSPVEPAPVVAPAAPAPAPAATPVAQAAPVVAEPVAAAVPVPALVPAPAPAAAEAAPTAVAPAEPAAAGGKPVLTAAEETTVAQIMTKYNSKNAPKGAVRDYVKSDRFNGKVRPEVQAWLSSELLRLA